MCLEAQQRYFSYRAIVVAIVSQNSFVLVFLGYRTIIARYVAKWGIAQMCLCETKHQGGGVSHHFGGVLTSLTKYRAIWGTAAIVSQYRAIWGLLDYTACGQAAIEQNLGIRQHVVVLILDQLERQVLQHGWHARHPPTTHLLLGHFSGTAPLRQDCGGSETIRGVTVQG